MKVWKNVRLVLLTCLISCATNHKTPGSRSIAEVDVTRSELSASQVRKTLKSIYHSYLLGQVLLKEFDRNLDQNPQFAMDSDSYHQLLSIRSMVDEYEESIGEMYVDLVMVNALPKYSVEQKRNATESLRLIELFLSGNAVDTELPENLQPLILGNLREKQALLIEKLQSMGQDPEVTLNESDVIASIKEKADHLSSIRKEHRKDMNNYKVDDRILNEVLAKELKDKEFKSFKSKVKKLSLQFKMFVKAIVKGRSTSSDSIYPNAGAAGNISGRGFPANTWSLTYDDGPGGKTTPTVLKNLQTRNMKATFFMLAKQVEGLPNTAKSIADAGMDLASHSYDHAQLTKVGPVALEKQIGGSKKIIEAKLGQPIKLFRLPYGAGVSMASIRAKIAEHNMVHVFWNVDTLDWQDKNPTSIFNRAVKQMNAATNNGGVVLFHDIHAQSVTASAMLMDYFIKQKINVCTVQAVVDQLNQGLPTCQP